MRKLSSGRWQARYRDRAGTQHAAPTTFATERDAMRWLATAEARVRALHPAIEVLFMSVYKQPVLTSQGRPATGVALLDKPFPEVDLRARAWQVLSGYFERVKTVTN